MSSWQRDAVITAIFFTLFVGGLSMIAYPFTGPVGVGVVWLLNSVWFAFENRE